MKFNDLTQEDKFKVWFDYKLVFIFMKHIDKFIFNEMTLKSFVIINIMKIMERQTDG